MEVQATRMDSEAEARALEAEASTGLEKPPRNQGRNPYGANGPLAGLWLRPMKQRRLRQRKSEVPLVVHAGTGIFMRICLSCQGAEM
jgi:hypothetical protein